MIYITSGIKYTDIDGLASIVAYNELLKHKKQQCEMRFLADFNLTVPEVFKDKYIDIRNKENNIFDQNRKFIVLDLSDPDFIPINIRNRVINIYDHHFGFEDYWKERLGKNAVIEEIGACATLIWREFKKNNLKPSALVADLISLAIISNTLNLQAFVTKDEDKKALKELEQYRSLKGDWVAKYFEEVSSSIIRNPFLAIKNDTKEFNIPKCSFLISQIELWNSKQFIKDNLEVIKNFLLASNMQYKFLTSPSISEGKNYLVCFDNNTKELLMKTLNAEFDGDIGILSKLMLRKEIMRELKK